jgi:hypothetical protein
VRTKLTTVLTSGILIALGLAVPAAADTTTSSNWAGYAVHHSGMRFTKVIGSWRQPSVHCTAGRRTYSAMWVGLGGYGISSRALEQIGTEVDCNGSGHVVSTAWYELVPAASRPIRMLVRPGDSIAATVTVTGHRTQLSLWDATRHRAFHKTLGPSVVDVSSAEWILEAPSACDSATSCHTLPLANFGTATFSLASAQSTTGHAGTIADSTWGATKIRLAPSGRRYVLYGGFGAAGGGAAPGALSPDGSSFEVRYSSASARSASAASTQNVSVRAGQLFHPGRW